MQETNDKRLLIGKINGLFGIKGFVKVFSYTKPRKNIVTFETWYLEKDGQYQKVKVQQGREQSKTIVALLEYFDTPEKSATLVGKNIYIDKMQLPDIKDDQYYWDDLITLDVFDQNNENIGRVDSLIETGSNDVLVIKKSKKEILVPFIEPFIIKVSLKDKQIFVDWEEDDDE
jgi:16S rRNA processing protein RimM